MRSLTFAHVFAHFCSLFCRTGDFPTILRCSLLLTFSHTFLLCRNRESRTLAAATQKKVDENLFKKRLKALHSELESVGFDKSKEGRFNLNTYSNLRERAQTLKVANDNKDLANRKLKDEIANLKLTIHKHAQPWHEQRIASTMIAKKAVWERSTAHMVDTYAECPVCEGGSGGAFSLSHNFSHFLTLSLPH